MESICVGGQEGFKRRGEELVKVHVFVERIYPSKGTIKNTMRYM
jgi:hypothetical protein